MNPMAARLALAGYYPVLVARSPRKTSNWGVGENVADGMKIRWSRFSAGGLVLNPAYGIYTGITLSKLPGWADVPPAALHAIYQGIFGEDP